MQDRRPAERADQDPGDRGRPARDHRGRSAEGISVNVTLIFSRRALPRGHGRLPRRPGAGRGERPRPLAASLGRVASSSPASTPRSTSGWTRSAPPRRRPCEARRRIANARLAYEAYEEVVRRRPLEGAGGRRAPTRSARCGPPPASRTRPTTTPATSIELVAPAPSTRCRRRPSTRSPTTASTRRHGHRHLRRRPQAVVRRARRARHRPRRRRRACSRTRASTSSSSPGTSCWRRSRQLDGAKRYASRRPGECRAGEGCNDRAVSVDRIAGGPMTGAKAWTTRCGTRATGGSRGSRVRAGWSSSASPATCPARS